MPPRFGCAAGVALAWRCPGSSSDYALALCRRTDLGDCRHRIEHRARLWRHAVAWARRLLWIRRIHRRVLRTLQRRCRIRALVAAVLGSAVVAAAWPPSRCRPGRRSCCSLRSHSARCLGRCLSNGGPLTGGDDGLIHSQQFESFKRPCLTQACISDVAAIFGCCLSYWLFERSRFRLSPNWIAQQ